MNRQTILLAVISIPPIHGLPFWIQGEQSTASLRHLFLTLRYRSPNCHRNWIYPTTPAPNKVKIDEVVDADPGGYQRQERSQQNGPAVFLHHFKTKQINVASQFPEGAGIPAQLAVACSESGEEFVLVASARNFGVRGAYRGQSVCVAPCHLHLALAPGKNGSMTVSAGKHLAVAAFDAGKISGKPLEIVGIAASRDGREHVIHRKKQPLFGKISDQANQVVAAAIDFRMLPLGQVVDAHVRLCAAGHRAGNFLAEEKIRGMPGFFPATERVVVSQRDQIHRTAPQAW